MLIFAVSFIGNVVAKVSIHDTDTRSARIYSDQMVTEGLTRLMTAEQICGHEAIERLIPTIQESVVWFKPTGTVLDTSILSKLVWPSLVDDDRKHRIDPRLVGSHSLEAWGRRMGYPTNTNSELLVTVNLLERLRVQNPATDAVALEHQVATIVARQVRHGIDFDREAACQLYQDLLDRRDALTSQLRACFAPRLMAADEFNPHADNAALGYTAGCPLTRLELRHFDPANRQEIARALVAKYRWEPRLTKSGAYELTDDTLGSLEYPEASLCLDYLVIDKRLSQLRDGQEGWLRHVTSKGRIHGQVNTIGTETHRMAHHSPALNQVPTVKKAYGRECRTLFKVPAGFKMLGVDATQLELVMLAHYLHQFDQGDYAKLVTSGDSHATVAELAGLQTRDEGKQLTYKLIYGGRAEPRVELVFFQRMPAFKKLLDAVRVRAKERGHLVALDGRKVQVNDLHAALNRLLQSAGAIVMKRALVLLDKKLQKKGYRPGVDYEFLLNIHDEFQLMVVDAELPGGWAPKAVAELAQKAIRAAGEHYKLNCVLSSKFAIGDTWADTH